MTTPPDIEQNVVIGFKMRDPEGTAAVRVVAGHATRVGEGWAALGKQMLEMADALDALVAGANQEPTP